MKFTNEQAIESLKRELTNNGKKTLRMSDRTLSKVTEALLPKLADDEMGLPDFITTAMEILSPVNDNIGKDKSDFIKEWKNEHPEEAAPADEPDTKAKGNPEIDSLRQEIEALKKQRAEEESQRKLTAKKTDLAAKLRDKGVSDKEWLDALLSEVSISEETDVEAKAESYLKLYNKSKAPSPKVPAPNIPGAPSAGEVPEALKRAKELAEKERGAAKVTLK